MDLRQLRVAHRTRISPIYLTNASLDLILCHVCVCVCCTMLCMTVQYRLAKFKLLFGEWILCGYYYIIHYYGHRVQSQLRDFSSLSLLCLYTILSRSWTLWHSTSLQMCMCRFKRIQMRCSPACSCFTTFRVASWTFSSLWSLIRTLTPGR